ncbi:MAG TPA: peptide-methionine (R)-S-oxide reductase MsrB [Sphingomicrobium sp.]|nr:peptide-methionine (R)-S-oxide reductase MsrB [Sphingomicrobium sp.]
MHNLLTRRELIGAAGIGVAALVVIGRPGTAEGAAHFQVTHSAAEWKHMLGTKRYAVLREASTERAGSSPLLNEHRKGTFVCAGCKLPLYSSSTKFESGTGWPSFYKPLPNAVITRPDHKMFVGRTEVLCRRCGGHLGHVFHDGPKPTGLRYCMNGLALRFVPA